MNDGKDGVCGHYCDGSLRLGFLALYLSWPATTHADIYPAKGRK